MFPEYIYLAGPIISILALFFLMKFNSPPGDIVLNLFLIHKDSGRVLKTNNLGINVDSIADCISDAGCVWTYEELTKSVHKINLNII